MAILATSPEPVVLEHSGLSLRHTFSCGQCFRFVPEGDGYAGVAMGRPLFLKQQGSQTLFYCSKEEFEALWRGYFDLDRDYEPAHRLLAQDSYTKAAMEFGHGLRLLRQEPWETLCSFLISQCNNIPRIQAIIDALCRLCGEPVEYGGRTFYAFPTPEAVARQGLESLASIRAGYRAKYILSAAQRITAGVSLERIAAMETEEARRAVMEFDGVGRKVADCFLLFGAHKWDVFPVDTWMKKAAPHHGGQADGRGFGKVAGLAQQYIFYYARESAKKY